MEEATWRTPVAQVLRWLPKGMSDVNIPSKRDIVVTGPKAQGSGGSAIEA
jgi:hypothetical protein